MIETKLLDDAVTAGLESLALVLRKETPTKEDFTKARLGASIASTSVRYLSTINSMVSLRFRVAESIIKNAKERRKYLATSSPELKLLKQPRD